LAEKLYTDPALMEIFLQNGLDVYREMEKEPIENEIRDLLWHILDNILK
jgi:hypothetical protein